MFIFFTKINLCKIMLLKVLITACLVFEPIDAACGERSAQMLGAEDICWTTKVKFADRVHYTTKSVLNFAKEKLGFIPEEVALPQTCDYYKCIFGELKMLNGNGNINHDKIMDWIDNNIIYKHAKTLYDTLNKCNSALTRSRETKSYFDGNLTNPSTISTEEPKIQNECEILKEFMKCLSMAETECVIFKYP